MTPSSHCQKSKETATGSIIKSIITKKIAASITLAFVPKLNIDMKSLEHILKTSQLKPIARGTSKTFNPRISPYEYVPNKRLVWTPIISTIIPKTIIIIAQMFNKSFLLSKKKIKKQAIKLKDVKLTT